MSRHQTHAKAIHRQPSHSPCTTSSPTHRPTSLQALLFVDNVAAPALVCLLGVVLSVQAVAQQFAAAP